MWKRMMALLAVACVSVASVCALEEVPPYVAIGVGGNLSVSIPTESYAPSSIHPSIETRARVMWFDFSLVADYTPREDGYSEFSTFLGIGLCNREARKLRVGVEIGPRFRWVLKDDGEFYLDREGNPVPLKKDLDYFAHSPVDYRLTVDYLLENNLAVGCFYQVDTDYRFESWEQMVDLVKLDWDTGRVGVSCIYFFDLKGGKSK